MSVIIYGKQGCGKTTNAEKLREFFKKDAVIDGLNSGDEVPENAIAFTNVPHPGAIHFNEAMSRLRDAEFSENCKTC